MESKQHRVMFVDDEPGVLDGFRRMLRTEAARWELQFATSVDEAVAIARATPPDAVISDIAMPGKDGFELLVEFAGSNELRLIPVVILTGLGEASLKRRALDLGAVDLLTKPVQAVDLISRLESVLKMKEYEDRLRRQKSELEALVAERTRHLELSRLEVVMRLAMVCEHRDTETGQHVMRVAHASRVIGERLGLSRQGCEMLFLASPLHDVGKIGIPDRILLKGGPLTEEERAEMQRHCGIGHRILSGSAATLLADPRDLLKLEADHGNELLDVASRIALGHHERWDGAGYPGRFKGETTPLAARIVAAADMFDALASARPYKPAFPLDRVRRMLKDAAGSQLDPAVWTTMDSAWDDLAHLFNRLADAPEPATAAVA
jgi:putative two-component system response regulator